MSSIPLVSVIMPVYNTETYVAESVRSILSQTYSRIELICINDGSTDGTLDILKSFEGRIVIINLEKNSGIAAGRNAGIRAATGDFIAFADADDIWKPAKLECQMEQLRKNPDIDISFCMIENFVSPELSDKIQSARKFPEGPVSGQISGTVLAKKECFDRVGPLDESYRVGEFIDWMARARAVGYRHSMVPEVLYLRRAHATNTTLSRHAQLDYLKIARAALDRNRSSHV